MRIAAMDTRFSISVKPAWFSGVLRLRQKTGSSGSAEQAAADLSPFPAGNPRSLKAGNLLFFTVSIPLLRYSASVIPPRSVPAGIRFPGPKNLLPSGLRQNRGVLQKDPPKSGAVHNLQFSQEAISASCFSPPSLPSAPRDRIPKGRPFSPGTLYS